MCMAIEKECACGKESARLHHLNSILPYEAIKTIYCPSCNNSVEFNASNMVKDNGWLIEYDMEVAALYAEKMGMSKKGFTPERIFDEGYSSWQGFTPNDLDESNREKTEMAKIAKADPKRYLQMIREWSINRTKRLQEQGWRKAQETMSA